MTITAPSKFKRSSERRDDPNQVEEKRVAEVAREEQRQLMAFESIGCSAAAASVLVDRAPEKWEREVDRMLAEDQSTFDADGLVR